MVANNALNRNAKVGQICSVDCAELLLYCYVTQITVITAQALNYMIQTSAENVRSMAIPRPAQSMPEVNKRIAEWYEDGMLVSAPPTIVGTIANAAAFQPFMEAEHFRTIAAGNVELDHDGTIAQFNTDTPSSMLVDAAIARQLIAPLLGVVNSDVRDFAEIPDDKLLKAYIELKCGRYITSEERQAHTDPLFGLGYFACLGPSTEFLPGYFPTDEGRKLLQQSDYLPIVSFGSGTIVRADETMLHRAPIMDSLVPRVLARIIIAGVRQY